MWGPRSAPDRLSRWSEAHCKISITHSHLLKCLPVVELWHPTPNCLGSIQLVNPLTNAIPFIVQLLTMQYTALVETWPVWMLEPSTMLPYASVSKVHLAIYHSSSCSLAIRLPCLGVGAHTVRFSAPFYQWVQALEVEEHLSLSVEGCPLWLSVCGALGDDLLGGC